MAVTVEDARHVATLARLAFSDEELERFTRDLSEILEYVENLRDVDVAGVGAAPRGPGPLSALRSDAVGKMLSPEDALSNAPDVEANRFRVPGVLPDD